jgi:hypothetical protein
MGAGHPFREIEDQLRAPAADGVLLYHVRDGSPFWRAGFRTGDVVTGMAGKAVRKAADLLIALQPQPDQPNVLTLEVLRDGRSHSLEAPRSRRWLGACDARRGLPAWEDLSDSDYAPDFSGLGDGRVLALRMYLGDEPAGFERLVLSREGDRLRVETMFHIGGGEGETRWSYRTRARSLHRLDRWLTTLETEFHEGDVGRERLAGRLVRGEDGTWRGVHGTAEGEEGVAFPDLGLRGPTAYSTTLLPLTLPLEPHARLTFPVHGDGTGVAMARHRLECLGSRDIDVLGERVTAWGFAWRHYGYGKPGEDEVFWVDAARDLVRIDWGEGYGGCWGVRVPDERLLEGVPPHVTLE